MDLKFGIQIGSDWPEMGQMWDILRSALVHFGSPNFTSLVCAGRVSELSKSLTGYCQSPRKQFLSRCYHSSAGCGYQSPRKMFYLGIT